MLFKFILSFCLLLITQQSFAQNHTIDSLNNALENHIAKDTTRVSILNHLAFSYYNTDPPKALSYLEESFTIARAINSDKSLAHCHYIKAVVLTGQSEFDDALTNYGKAIELYTNINDFNGLKKCNNAMGVLYGYKGDHDQALKHYEQAFYFQEKSGNYGSDKGILYNISNIYLEKGNYQKALDNLYKVLRINREAGDSSGILNCYNSLALVYYEQSNYPVSLKYHNQSLKIAQSINDSIGIFRAYTNLGNLYRQQYVNDKALDYYNKALAIESAKHNIKNVTALKNNIAGIYYDESQFEKAIKLFKESIELSKEIEDNINMVTAYNGLGFVYYESKNYKQALNYFNEALENGLENNYSYDVLDSYQGLSDTYYITNDYDLALENALKFKDSAEKFSSLRHQKNAARILSEIYEKQGRFEEALVSHQQYKLFNDSLFNKENVEKITALEYEYKYKSELENAKNKEIKLTKTVKETSSDLERSQRNLLLGIILFLTVVLLLGGIIFFLRLKNAKERTQNIITEQKLLRSQMTPHFIFNAMSVLQGIILNSESRKAVLYLSKFSRLLRLTLENSRDQLVSIKKELDAIENYLELQNIEANIPYNYSINVDSAINQEELKIPPMLIQPFIENSIEHGFDREDTNKQITINVSYSNNLITCVIIDNGKGIQTKKESTNKYKTSLSTVITTERLEILSKNSKTKGSISIEDRKNYNEQGTIVTLTIPYQKEDIQ